MATTLLLLRHAKSSWREPVTADFERPLSGRGVRDGSDFGRVLIDSLPEPDLVLCSSARRTRDTLSFLIPELVDPRRVWFDDELYHASAPALLDRIRDVPAITNTLMVVGHNPGLTDLVNMLVSGERGVIDNLPTFGCARFHLTTAFAQLERGNARLAALLRPKDEPQGKL